MIGDALTKVSADSFRSVANTWLWLETDPWTGEPVKEKRAKQQRRGSKQKKGMCEIMHPS